MQFRKTTFSSTSILVFILLVALALFAGPAVAKRFSERSVQGCYVISLLGTVLPDPTNPAFQLPLSSLVRFCADGEGHATAVATQNIGGSCITEQTGRAKYSVDRNGLGVVMTTLENEEVSPGCSNLSPPPGVGEKADFEFRFGIQRDKCLPVIGTALVPEGGDPVGIVTQGQACPQSNRHPRDDGKHDDRNGRDKD